MTRNKIIVALDVPTAGEAEEIIRELREEVGAFKIGLQLFTSAGASFVRKIVDQEVRIFLDVKFHDIPNTVAKASVEVARLGVWMFNVHAQGGGEMLRRTAGEVGEFCERENLKKPKIIGVTVLTSLAQADLKDVGVEKNLSEQVTDLARLVGENGLDGVVASTHEVKSIREKIPGGDFLIVTPGIRPEFALRDDQKRVMTPSEAVKAGADFLVIGRPITQAADKRSAVRQIIEEMNS